MQATEKNLFEVTPWQLQATMLDPRFKQLEPWPSAADATIESIEALVESMQQAERGGAAPSHPHVGEAGAPPPAKASRVWLTHARAAPIDMTELKRYLLLPALEYDADITAWWNDHKNAFPHLYVLARTYATAPATTCAVESTFSVAGRIADPYRSLLTPTHLDEVLFVAQNARALNFKWLPSPSE